MLRDALLENIHRVQLNPLEEAAAYQQLLEEFGATHEELASKIGRSRSQVTNTIRLMKLPVKVQTRVAAGVISAGHARALLGLPEAEAQDALATRIVAEGMSVRATEEAVAMAVAESPTATRRTARKISAPGSRTSAGRLSDVFETKVKVQIGRAKGRIVVEFGSVDDLQRIVGMMAPDITGWAPAGRCFAPTAARVSSRAGTPSRGAQRAELGAAGRAICPGRRRGRSRRPRRPSGTSTSR